MSHFPKCLLYLSFQQKENYNIYPRVNPKSSHLIGLGQQSLAIWLPIYGKHISQTRYSAPSKMVSQLSSFYIPRGV
uniref:Putative ovule protein n=1 Tax=Solanum chacoense TaxID=4108 RepID=A0A0V0HJA5_SOLCH